MVKIDQRAKIGWNIAGLGPIPFPIYLNTASSVNVRMKAPNIFYRHVTGK